MKANILKVTNYIRPEPTIIKLPKGVSYKEWSDRLIAKGATGTK